MGNGTKSKTRHLDLLRRERDDPLFFRDRDAWQQWLRRNHATSKGAWLQIAKKGAATNSVSYAEALETALCYGWIDGQKRLGPEGFWLQRFTPRRSRSIWSQVNREKALALIATGHMQPAGLKAIHRAQQNGCWESAYESVSAAQIPEDLGTALIKNARAREFFEALSSHNRYAILFRLQTAKKPATRAKRLEKFMRMLEDHETIHPQQRKTP